MAKFKATPVIDRLLSRCTAQGDCWVFTGTKNKGGYARINVNGRLTVGHRVAYEFFIAPIPDGLTFDHLCRNTSCVNPYHGDLVPLSVNVRRAAQAKTHCALGHPLQLSASGQQRLCRECVNASSRKYEVKKRQRIRADRARLQEIQEGMALIPGFCACGCGGTTTIAQETRADRGYIKGQPLKYMAGHKGTRGLLGFAEPV